jgi:demethylmenaquinone methyltransferase / 2-methoxy-6-polyprenyl-1,4-benzoquinol methylase
MQDDGRSDLVRRFFAGTGSTYDWVVKTSTLGADLWWKRKIIQSLPGRPSLIMDQACGTGILTLQIARRFPGCHVIGVDINDEYLQIAKAKAGGVRLDNVEFLLGRAEEVFVEGPFDGITSSYLAKYAELEALIQNVKEMLGAGGVLVMHDFIHPKAQSVALILNVYFKLLRAIACLLIPQWRVAVEGLPGLIRETRWVEKSVSLLNEHGFESINVEVVTFGVSAIVTARKPL